MNKGIGQYDLEYSSCSCFWGTEPGKFVRPIPDLLGHQGTVLDIGAGEGKNSIFLASAGFTVTAIEVSVFAVHNFSVQLEKLDLEIQNRITIINEDILSFDDVKSYDVVIAYGLLHCLSSLADVEKTVNKIKQLTKLNGVVVIVSFNNELGVPKVQEYLEPTLLPKDYLLKAFNSWTIIEYENGIITETHPTTNIEHQHSVTRLIAKFC